ncbi:MAG: LysM peptidoglycan-binding domain-containing protein [Chloroflexi bacterium]|nr:LysM peptidoglycan-binding domain-containing protein [Chloroflexota bacterium]
MILPADWLRLPALWFCLLALLMVAGGGLLRGQDNEADDLVHTVVANETLTSIASVYGVTVSELISRNSLDNPDILSVGKQLLIFTAEERRQRAEANPTAALGEEEPVAVGAGLSMDILAAAPLTPAAAPKVDPTDRGSELCLIVYDDRNDNGTMEPGESLLANATIRLLDSAGLEQQRIVSASQPHCQRDLPPSSYQLVVGAPPGHGLTSPAKLQIQLREGSRISLEIGARQGRQTFPVPVPGAPVPEATAVPSDAEPSVLYGMSGLLLLALAGLVLASGFALALFVRTR